MSIDTSAPPFAATAEHLIETVTQARAEAAAAVRERDEAIRRADVEHAEAVIQRLRADALEAELHAVLDELRITRNAPAYWKARCEQAEETVAALRDRPTVEIPRVLTEPEPPVRSRSRRRGRHQ